MGKLKDIDIRSKELIEESNKVMAKEFNKLGMIIKDIDVENNLLKLKVIAMIMEMYMTSGSIDIQKSKSKIEELKREVSKVISEGKKEEEERIIGYLLETAIDNNNKEKGKSKREKKREKNEAMELILLSWAGANIIDRMKRNKNTLIKNVNKTIVKSSIMKDELFDTIRKIEESFDEAGRMTSMLFDTENSRVRYETEIVEKFKEEKGRNIKLLYNATFDNSCEECMGLHGEIFDLGYQPQLPMHPNCRCFYVPFEG